MPLQRQTITLPFALGVDTKTDGKQVALGKLSRLENGVFGTLKQIRKRNGYAALSTRVTTSSGFSQLTEASALTSYRDELLAIGRSTTASTEDRLFSYAEGALAWTDKGSMSTCSVAMDTVARGTVGRTCVDGATTDSGLQVYAWEEAGAIRYAVRDTISGQLIITSGLVAAAGVKPRVVPFIGGALIYYIDTSTGVLYVTSMLASLGASLTSASALTSVVPGTANTMSSTAATRCFDVVLSGVQVMLAFSNDAAGVTVRRYDSSNVLSPAAQQVAAVGASPNALAIAIDSAASNVQLLAAVTTNLVCATADSQLVNAFSGASSLLILPAGSTWQQLGLVAVTTAPASTRWRIWATLVVTATGRYSTVVAQASNTAFTTYTTRRSIGLAAKPWVYNGRAFAMLGFVSRTTGSPSGLQNQLVVASDSTGTTDFEPVARVLYTTSAGLPSTVAAGQATLPTASDVGGDRVRIATLEASTIGAPVGDVQSVVGVVAVDFDFSVSPLTDNRSELGGSLIFGGGLPMQYDGVGPVELGFLVWPDECSVSLGSGGSLSAGAYQWVAVYEWADNNGFIHRSAASLPASATATASQQATLTVSTLTMTRKDARTPVKIVVYRTLANGSVFYRASSLTAPTSNDATQYTLTLTDGLDDATLATRPQLYTTGGVVENIVPGALDGLAVHRSRLWGVDATNRLRLWFSRQVQAGAPVEFSDVLVFDVDARGGEVVALASLDDKLIVFKRTQVFMVAGQGPDATGSQNDFSDAVLVTTDAGCIDARSIVTTPSGLMFQSTKGIYLLDRSLGVTYLGADVEAYNGATVESAQLIPTSNQVRFILSTGVALVYDYLVGQWSVFTNHPAVDSVVWRDSFCWLRADGTAMQEDPTRFDDDGSFVPLLVKTGWIVFQMTGAPALAAGGNRAPEPLQGYQRARRLLVLGEYAGAHRLRVQVGFDYSPSPLQDVTVTPTAPSDYGAGSPYGGESPYGSEWDLYQWRVDLSRQKCAAVQVTISDERNGEASSEGVRLSALALELGMKPGTTRVPTSHMLG